MGLARQPEYKVWSNMIRRCHNPKDSRYKSYGGRGLEVYSPWRTSFEAFVADVGPRPSMAHTLDRIDNDKGYEPSNVQWATREEQDRNKRTTRFLEVEGYKKTLMEWSRAANTHHRTIQHRLAAGWPTAEAIFGL